jgi:hypothetical protein
MSRFYNIGLVFDGTIMDLSQCKVAISQILLVMLVLRALHSRYSDLLEHASNQLSMLPLILLLTMLRITTGSPSTSTREPSLLHLLLMCRLPLAPTQIRRAMFGKCHLNGC